MKRVLLDQGLPRRAASLLRESGWDAVHVGELGLACSPDEEILDRARRERRICITLDADFHALLVATGRNRPSVLRIRIEGLRAEGVAGVVRTVWRKVGSDLESGAIASVTQKSIRVRRLPIGQKDLPKTHEGCH